MVHADGQTAGGTGRVHTFILCPVRCDLTVVNVLCQVLGGHEGPVSCLSFSPVQSVLASASWDRTVRLWDMLDSWQAKETLVLTADGVFPCRGPPGGCRWCSSLTPPCRMNVCESVFLIIILVLISHK